MCENMPLLSICIPTYKRPEIVDILLKSIISQDVDQNLYEICITDNSKTDETSELIRSKYGNISNLHYKKTTCEGFLNSVEAMHFGSGKYIKLHNDYSIFNAGSIYRMIEIIRKADDTGANIYFSFGVVDGAKGVSSFDCYDDFARFINYQATWSSAFGIWKADLERIDKEGILPNYMFPHTSYLHRLTECKRYIVDNNIYVYSTELKKKGGYNLIDNFVRIYLTMVKEDILEPKHISNETYQLIEDGILQFCTDWFYVVKNNKDKYTFTFENDEEIVRSTGGESALSKYKKYKFRKGIRNAVVSPVKVVCKRIYGVFGN